MLKYFIIERIIFSVINNDSIFDFKLQFLNRAILFYFHHFEEVEDVEDNTASHVASLLTGEDIAENWRRSRQLKLAIEVGRS